MLVFRLILFSVGILVCFSFSTNFSNCIFVVLFIFSESVRTTEQQQAVIRIWMAIDAIPDVPNEGNVRFMATQRDIISRQNVQQGHFCCYAFF